MTKKLKIFSFLLFLLSTGIIIAQGRQKLNFNHNWQFCNQEDVPVSELTKPFDVAFSFRSWETVSLPHSAKTEPLVIKSPWEGISWYKKDFVLKPEWKGQKIILEFEAVMQQADVWLNGKKISSHTGGYLPFSIDISDVANYEGTNRLIVKADNHDHPEIPPGKPIANLDFCYYSGIYRNVSLLITSPLHITDAVDANLAASGGLRVWYPEISEQSAKIAVSTHIKNESSLSRNFVLNIKLADKNGKIVAQTITDQHNLPAGGAVAVVQNLTIQKPGLWHPEHPHLYKLIVEIKERGIVTDRLTSRIGIRKFEIIGGKFTINGRPLLLTGTNRHQEYPYVGNALSDNAQYRDALKIKQAGFNIVRLSHYPQSPAFMAACDELGLLTIDAIPGWQFVGNEAFIQHAYKDARELIRRDRNHACVAMWELSLNESDMPDEFMKKMNEIASEESPESDLITCGWIDRFYDVYIPARQHAKPPHYWKKYDGKIPLFTGEYGDWEYFAQDAGLNQAGYAGLKPDERTSRQLRGDGEKRLLQQAANFQEAHNDNLRNPHLGDANWLMYDYNRGYSPDIESSGIMDLFRLPKFSYYFYRSQSLPTLKIATYWNPESDFSKIRVYSDAEEVALYLNNELIDRKKASKYNNSDALNHPPFVFELQNFKAGTLKAIAYKNGKLTGTDEVCTAGKPYAISLWYDKSGKALKADGADVVFVHAAVMDQNGVIVPLADNLISFTVKGDAGIAGPETINAEAGIATILLRAGTKAGTVRVTATGKGVLTGNITIQIF